LRDRAGGTAQRGGRQCDGGQQVFQSLYSA
jgi:hypothetical protein